ncbi:MAG: hypothetical protein IIB08_02400 [Bacteroidetes bacterium]|nr:hypothetical protein [Bacteroidota bacterium]
MSIEGLKKLKDKSAFISEMKLVIEEERRVFNLFHKLFYKDNTKKQIVSVGNGRVKTK